MPKCCHHYLMRTASFSIMWALYTHLPPSAWPKSDPTASCSLKGRRSALVSAGLPASTANVVYPGVRCDHFGNERVGMPMPLLPDGSRQRPLKVCLQGYSQAGAHTLIEALIQLKNADQHSSKPRRRQIPNRIPRTARRMDKSKQT